MGILQHTFYWLAVVCLFLTSQNITLAQNADHILGKWLNANKDATIEIYKEGNIYYGKIIWLAETQTDSLQQFKLSGKDILTNFTFSSQNKIWENGKVYYPDNGKIYHCKMWLNSDGSLSVKEYSLISILGKTTKWIRPTKTHACYQNNFRNAK